MKLGTVRWAVSFKPRLLLGPNLVVNEAETMMGQSICKHCDAPPTGATPTAKTALRWPRAAHFAAGLRVSRALAGLVVCAFGLLAGPAMYGAGSDSTSSVDLVLKPMELNPALFSGLSGESCDTLVSLYAAVLAAQFDRHPSGPPSASPACTFGHLHADYLIVQIVDWNQVSASAPQPTSNWILLQPKNVRLPGTFLSVGTSATRIFGSKKIAYVIIHRNLAHPARADIRYTLAVKQKNSVQLTDLESLISILGPSVEPAGLPPIPEIVLAVAGMVSSISKLPDDIVFTGTAFLDAGQEAAGGKPDASFPETYDDEGFASWDISASVPFTGLSSVQYSSTNGTLVPKTVTRVNSYGMAHWYPYPVDLKGDYPWFPSFVGGLALAGQPLDKPFAGISLGTRKPLPIRVNVFAGAVFNKVFTPATPPSTQLQSHRVTKLMFGIDLPIGALLPSK